MVLNFVQPFFFREHKISRYFWNRESLVPVVPANRTTTLTRSITGNPSHVKMSQKLFLDLSRNSKLDSKNFVLLSSV